MEYIFRVAFGSESLRVIENRFLGLEIFLNFKCYLPYFRSFQLVNKRMYSYSIKYFQDFYDIPYKDDSEDYNNAQLRLIKNNRQYFQFHTSWFVAMSMHHCVDLVDNYSSCLEKDRRTCLELKCPPLCGYEFTKYDNAVLMRRTLGLKDEQYGELLKEIDLLTFKHLWIYFILKCAIVNLDQKILVTMPKIILYDMFFISTFPTEFYKFNEDVFKTVSSLVDKRIVADIVCSLGCLQAMINRPEVKIKNAFVVIYPLIRYIMNNFKAYSNVVSEIKIAEMKIIKISNDTVIKFTISHVRMLNDKKYLYSNECITVKDQLNCYIITHCLTLLSEISKIRIIVPQVFLGNYGISMILLPSGATTIYDKSELSRLGPNELLDSFAIFTVISYLFGLHKKQIAYSKKGIFHIDYSRIYEKDKLRMGTIITALGGRSSPLYKQFILMATNYYLKLRKYYSIVSTFLSVLRQRREVIDQRFQPQLTDERATNIFTNKLKEMGDLAMKNWKILGY